MSDKNKELQKELAKVNQGEESSNEVVFDPSTGELVVAQEGEQVSPDATPVTQIAGDGFAYLQ